MQDHMLDALKIRYWFYSITPCLKDIRRIHPHTNRQTTQKFLMNRKAPSVRISLFPCFLPSFCLSSSILTSHLWAARTDRLHNQIREPPSRHLLTDQLEGRWFSCFVWAVTRWEAHRSPESSAHCLSASAGQKSFLLSYPYSRFYLHNFHSIFIPCMRYLFYYLYVLSSP